VLMRDKDESTTTYSLQFLLWLFCRSPLLEGSRTVFTASIGITIKALLLSYHDISNYLTLILPHSYIELRSLIIENFVSLRLGHSWLEIIKRYLQKPLGFVSISFISLKFKPHQQLYNCCNCISVYHTQLHCHTRLFVRCNKN
jgi:hypothetical protein